MVKGSLEAGLRRRVVAYVLPALVVVGASAVIITSRILASADRTAAQNRAGALAAAMSDELAEGDGFDTAASEVLGALEREKARGLVRHASRERATAGLPAPLRALEPDACATATDGAGTWTACGARHGKVEAVAALRVDEHRSAVARLAAWMALVVALALGAAAAAVRAALRPPMRELSRLTAWADALAASTEHAPAPSASHAEIERLATALSTLVDRLLDALARERASSAHIAHELRTPLAALRADVDLLGAAAGDAAERMRGDIARLDRVIEAILVLSAPPGAAAARDVVNVADVARAAAGGVEVRAPDEALVSADARLVELAVANLLENAARHGGGARSVEVRRDGDAVAVAVLDDGPGVPEDELDKMFERYWRGAADGRGSGIGLAFVRAVAERYGGTARARPRAGARGLEVAFTLGPLLGWEET